jgi:hypothetical protein
MTHRPTPPPHGVARPTPGVARPTPAPRPTPRVVSAHETPYLLVPVPPVRPRRTWPLPALAVLMVIATGVTSVEPPAPRTLPDAVHGTWHGTATSHAERTLVLSRDVIAIGTGGRATTPHAVSAVTARQRADSTFLEVHYRETPAPDAATTTLRLAYATATPTALLVGGSGRPWVRER